MALSSASSSSPPPYLLAFEGAAHTKAVRCVCTVETSHHCIPSSSNSSSTNPSSSISSFSPSSHTEIITGSLDKSIIVWSSISPDQKEPDVKENSSSQTEPQDKTSGATDRTPLQYKPRLHLTPHTDFVYCVAPCLSEKGTSFFSGSKDQRALRISLRDGHVLASYVGHEGPVNSLSEVSDPPLLVTGSWDGTARLWCIDTAECIRKLDQHKYAVTVLALHQPSMMITGSQDKTLRLWSSTGDSIKKTIPSAHDDIIRALDSLPSSFLSSSWPSSTSSGSSSSTGASQGDTTEREKTAAGFLSASNDQLVKAWSLDGTQLGEFEGHAAFVFDVKASHVRNGRIFTASDDCTCKVWKVALDEDSKQQEGHMNSRAGGGSHGKFLKGEVQQTILHAASVWQVAELPSGEIATACEDGKLRLWTVDEARALPLAERSKQLEEAKNVQEAAASKKESAIDLATLPDISQQATTRGKKDGEVKMFREGGMAVVYRWEQGSGTWMKIGEVVGAAKEKTFYEGDDYFEAGEYDHVFNVEIGEGGGAYKKLPFRQTDNPLVAAEKFCARECISKSCLEQITSFIRRNAGLTSTSSSRDMEGGGNFSSSSQSRGHAGSDFSSSSSSQSSYGGRRESLGSGKHFPLLQVITFAKGNYEAAGKKILQLNAELPPDSKERMSELEQQYFQDAIEKIKSPSFMKQEFRTCEIEVIFEKLARWPLNNSMPVMDIWRVMALHPLYHIVHKKTGDQGLSSDQVLKNSSKNVRLTAATVCTNFAVALSNKEEKEIRCKVIGLLRRIMESETDTDVFYRCLVALGTLIVNLPQPQQWVSLITKCKEYDVPAVLPPLNENVSTDGKVGDAAQDLLLLLE
ncbi:pul domain-containing protein [Cystoisospora suis]|uniref:Pul domain-containing protein n=1 Tax=Cystoisospora suis TaxID=483139 RepID=A0A2C6L867_9APIC|nr:pul domain-containing protein [Cystoisospora suis]